MVPLPVLLPMGLLLVLRPTVLLLVLLPTGLPLAHLRTVALTILTPTSQLSTHTDLQFQPLTLLKSPTIDHLPTLKLLMWNLRLLLSPMEFPMPLPRTLMKNPFPHMVLHPMKNLSINQSMYHLLPFSTQLKDQPSQLLQPTKHQPSNLLSTLVLLPLLMVHPRLHMRNPLLPMVLLAQFMSRNSLTPMSIQYPQILWNTLKESQSNLYNHMAPQHLLPTRLLVLVMDHLLLLMTLLLLRMALQLLLMMPRHLRMALQLLPMTLLLLHMDLQLLLMMLLLLRMVLQLQHMTLLLQVMLLRLLPMTIRFLLTPCSTQLKHPSLQNTILLLPNLLSVLDLHQTKKKSPMKK